MNAAFTKEHGTTLDRHACAADRRLGSYSLPLSYAEREAGKSEFSLEYAISFLRAQSPTKTLFSLPILRLTSTCRASSRVLASASGCWRLIRVTEGEREIGFIPRPLRQPKERLLATRDGSVHALLERCDVIDREVDLPFGWFFLMIQGHWVDQGVGLAIAQALKAQHVRLPDRDTAVLLRWSDSRAGR